MCMVMGGFRKTFQECLKRFTKQRLDLLIPSIDIRLDNLEDTLENSIRPVFSKNCASACWMIDIIIDSFIRVAFKYGSYNEPSFISEVQRHVTKQIQDELRSLTHGLDFDLITQLSMENYESQTGEGLTIALVPYAYPISDIGRLGHVLLFDPAQYCHLNNESIHAIRKQLNMTKGNCLLLGCGTSGGIMDFFSFGVGKASLLSYFPSIALLGHSKWSFQLPRKHDKHSLPECKIRYEGGRFMLPLVRTNSLERMILYNKLKDSCHHNRAFRPDLKILNKVISLAKSQKKRNDSDFDRPGRGEAGV